MFYAPSIVASMVAALSPEAHESYAEMYSDFHKDAIGCRPRKSFPESRVEGAVEVARLSAWVQEEERLRPMREEVARFDFSKAMEYRMRREGMTPLEAFKHAIQCAKVRPYPNDELPSWEEVMEDVAHYGWDFIAMDLGLPQKDGAKLKEYWEAHS